LSAIIGICNCFGYVFTKTLKVTLEFSLLSVPMRLAATTGTKLAAA
jgi:hypothetical protein